MKKLNNTMGGNGDMLNYNELTQRINEIMSLQNIENANANVDEASFSGKNEKAAGLLLKEYALDHLIDPKIAQYHKDGILYIHDLDRYSSGMHNCLIVDFDDLFKNNGGFSTRNGDVRRPNSIQSFFQLVAVVFQCQSQNQFGGVGSAKIDYEAAPYVAKTFTKKYKEALIDLFDLTSEEADATMKKIEDIGIEIRLGNEKLEEHNKRLYRIAKRHTEESARQGAESLYHNLNTLESRPGQKTCF